MHGRRLAVVRRQAFSCTHGIPREQRAGIAFTSICFQRHRFSDFEAVASPERRFYCFVWNESEQISHERHEKTRGERKRRIHATNLVSVCFDPFWSGMEQFILLAGSHGTMKRGVACTRRCPCELRLRRNRNIMWVAVESFLCRQAQHSLVELFLNLVGAKTVFVWFYCSLAGAAHHKDIRVSWYDEQTRFQKPLLPKTPGQNKKKKTGFGSHLLVFFSDNGVLDFSRAREKTKQHTTICATSFPGCGGREMKEPGNEVAICEGRMWARGASCREKQNSERVQQKQRKAKNLRDNVQTSTFSMP